MKTKQLSNHGSVIFNKKKYILDQPAYITTISEDTHYTAIAIDTDGNECIIEWDIININCDDESNACDWDNPRTVYTV